MRKLLLLFALFFAFASSASAQRSSTPPLGTWESSQSLHYASINMTVTYRRVRVVITAKDFKVTEWVKGHRDLPGVGLNFQMELREDWSCQYVWEGGDQMKVTRITQNPKTKIEKYSLGGDPNMLKLLKEQGVTAKTYLPSMEQSMNSNAHLFDVVGILVRNRSLDQFDFVYEGAITATMKRVKESPKESPKETPKEQATAPAPSPAPADTIAALPDTVAVTPDTIAVSTVVPAPKTAPRQPIVPTDSVATQRIIRNAESVVKVLKDKSWYTNTWESILSWF